MLVLRIFIIASLFSTAVRFDERKLALRIGILIAVLLAVAEVALGAGVTWLTAIGFVGDLAVCLVAMTVMTADPSGLVWLLAVMISSFLLAFAVPLAIARNLLGG